MRGLEVLLRQCVLAASVLGDLDLVPQDDGVELGGDPPVRVSWQQAAIVIGPVDPLSDLARRRLGRWLRLRRLVADHGPLSAALLARAARLMALPADHAQHPGPDWVLERVGGGLLDLGVGLHGLEADPEQTAVLPPGIALAAGIDLREWWPSLREHADRMGSLSAARLRRNADPQAVLRPVGGCHVTALLASRPLREHLAQGDGTGMRALAVPTLDRGWCDLRRIDPAFVGAAWSATDAEQRGLPRALLVTADEVAIAPTGQQPPRYATG
jgi:hypothetical protein